MPHKTSWVYDNRAENRIHSPKPSILKRSVADDSEEALAALGELRSFVEDASIGAVHDARLKGLPWSRIGELLGVSKQAVWSKYAGYDPQGGRIEEDD